MGRKKWNCIIVLSSVCAKRTKEIVKQQKIVKPNTKDKMLNSGGKPNGPRGGWTVPIRAGYWRNGRADTRHSWWPRTLKGHSLKIWVPVRVDCVSGQDQPPEATSPWAAGKQPHWALWLSRRQLSAWVFTARFWLPLGLTPESSFIYVLL